jgi:HSP20 family protein
MVNNVENVALTRPVEGGFARRYPFEEFTELRNRFDDFFGRGFTPLWRMIPNEPFFFEPPVEFFQTETGVELYMAIPGYVPTEINVECAVDSIIVYGERKPLHIENVQVKNQGVVTGESRFRVVYNMPVEIDPVHVKAVFTNGILHLTVPKSEKARTKNFKVPVIGE